MRRIVLLRIIGCVLFLSLVLYPSNSVVHYSEGNIFNRSFTEPVEICYVIFHDGYFLKFTTYDKDKIQMSHETFTKVLKIKGREVRDVAIVIHNHLPGYGRKFSRTDLYFLGQMEGDGFKGSFCLWFNGKVVNCRRWENK